MMKKLLFGSLTLFVLGFAKAQLTYTETVVTDTVHYYYNKHYYTQGGPALQNFPYTAAPALNNTTHMGSKFVNKEAIEISGLEGYSGIASLRKSQATMPVRLYLCNLDANGMPVLPAIDSVSSVVGTTVTVKVGGDFPFGRKHILTKDYAILIRNMSTHSGDSVKMVRTSARTYTAWAANNGPTWRDKYSDTMGVVRYLGKFYSTSDFTVSGFGKGTSYEFIVAPRVTYTLSASHIMPQKVVDKENICTFDAMTYTNSSSWRYSSPMYNFIEFNAKWNKINTDFAYYLAPPTGFPTDSAITWFFRDQDNGANKPDPRKCIVRGGATKTVTHYSDSAGCFEDCNFIARMWTMNTPGLRLTAQEQFTVCIDYCDDDALGVHATKTIEGIKLFPNPATTGKTQLTGLAGNNTILVYDLLGQLIFTETTNKDRTTIDLGNQPNGHYIVRVVNDAKQAKVIKLIKQN